MSVLDKEFDEVAISKINAKLREAVAALREVNELREAADIPSLIFSQWIREDLYRELRDEGLDSDDVYDRMDVLQLKFEKIQVDELERELSSAGWSTSGSYC